MSELIEGKNHGVIVAEPSAGDYIVGASPLPIEIINPSGNNLPYAPDEEHQSWRGGDKMDCVTVSSAWSLETIFRILISTNKIPQAQMEWLTKWKFFDKDGYIRLSTRWAAIQNGTTMEGNSANRVSEWWRQNGFIPEWMLPNNQELEWSQFYDTSCLTDEMRKCAEESKKLFSIKYEWILKESDYKASLQRGAIQVLTAVCPGWSSVNPIPACSLNVQHATELLNVQGDGKKDFWDSYDPHHKVFASDYPVPYRMLYLLKPIPQINEKNMILKKEKGKNDIWLIIEKNKTKINITDMPTFTPLCEDFVEVDNLDEYSENWALLWLNRKIN